MPVDSKLQDDVMNGSKINPLKHSGNNTYQVFQNFKIQLLPTR